MTNAREPELTDELLSAYIDNAVTPEERHFVERAVAADRTVAWRLESLQMTVRLLHELPALALPRSFMLTPEQAGEEAFLPVGAEPAPTAKPAIKPTARPQRSAAPARPGFWSQLGGRWRDFWQGGSLALRNAMATSLVLLFVFLAGPRLAPWSLGNVTVAPMPAPAAESAQASIPPQTTATALPAPGGAESEVPATEAAPADISAQAKTAAPETESVTDNAANAAPLAISAADAAPVAEDAVVAANAVEEPVLALAAPEQAAASQDATTVESPRVLDAVAARAASPARIAGEDVSPLVEAQMFAAPGMAAGAAAPVAQPLGAPVATGAESAAMSPAPARADTPATSAPTPTAIATATPTPVPTLTPAAAPTVAPVPITAATAARVADNQPMPAAPTMAIMPSAQPASSAQTPWLTLAQIAAGAGFLLFGLLWWRSRQR